MYISFKLDRYLCRICLQLTHWMRYKSPVDRGDVTSYSGIHCTVYSIMPWLCVDHMIRQGVWPMGFSYPDPLENPDPLAKSRPTDKIQTHR